MTAFGMGDRTYAKGLMTKALQGGTANGSLATTLNDLKILAFVKTFTSVSSGKSDTATMIASVVAKYHEVALEANQEKQSPGVALALYFQQNAPTVTDVYGLLADKKLLTVVQTALSISPLTGLEDLGTQANYLSKKINVADFKDPAKLQTFLTRFSALDDSNAASANQPSNALLVDNKNQNGTDNTMNALLSSANGSYASNSANATNVLLYGNSATANSGLDATLLSSMQGFSAVI